MELELRYRQLVPGLTHEQYLDEPWDVIQWFIHIDDLQNEIRQQNRKPGPDGAAGNT